MAELSYAEVAAAFEAERPTYKKLVKHARKRLAKAIKSEGIYATVTGRAKQTDSFATKALLGSRYPDPFQQIADKAGIRVVVPYLHQVEQVEELARQIFVVIDDEQKVDTLAYDELGYLGLHLDTRLSDEAATRLGDEFQGLRFEIQIRTIAQGAWAEVAHEQIYKPAAEVPDKLKRRMYRLISLVELFDNEVEGFLAEAAETPGFKEAVALEPLAEILLKQFGIRRRPDRQLSLTMAAAVIPLYDQPTELVVEHIETWILANEDKLRGVFEAAADTAGQAPVLLQPESFLILERLDSDPDNLLEAWPEEVPTAWLEDAAVAWGVRLPDAEGQDELRDDD